VIFRKHLEGQHVYLHEPWFVQHCQITYKNLHVNRLLRWRELLLSTVHCWSALDFGAGAVQPFNCLTVQNCQAVQSMRSSMDCTLEDSMVDGLFFCATLTGCSGGVAHLCHSGGVASASRSRNVQHRCQARPALFLGGWVLESGMKVLSLIVLSNHSAFHRWSAQVWRYSSKVDMSFFSILSTTCQSPSACMMNTLMSRLIQAVRKKTAGSHVALRRNISAPVRVTDLVEVSKDAESLVVRTLKKNFWLGVRFFFVSVS